MVAAGGVRCTGWRCGGRRAARRRAARRGCAPRAERIDELLAPVELVHHVRHLARPVEHASVTVSVEVLGPAYRAHRAELGRARAHAHAERAAPQQPVVERLVVPQAVGGVTLLRHLVPHRSEVAAHRRGAAKRHTTARDGAGRRLQHLPHRRPAEARQHVAQVDARVVEVPEVVLHEDDQRPGGLVRDGERVALEDDVAAVGEQHAPASVLPARGLEVAQRGPVAQQLLPRAAGHLRPAERERGPPASARSGARLAAAVKITRLGVDQPRSLRVVRYQLRLPVRRDRAQHPAARRGARQQDHQRTVGARLAE